VIVRPGFLSNHILGRSAIGPNDMTPLAMVSGERSVMAVRTASPLKSVADVIERLKQDPQSLSISVGSARGSTPHVMTALLAKLNGVDARRLKVVTFAGGAESLTQLLGGHIDLMAVSIDNAVAQYRNGAVRILGVSTAQRVAALPDVPTLRELGYDLVLGGFTIVMGTRGLTPAQIAYWENMIERAVNHADWKRQLAVDFQDPDFRKSAATREHLRQQYEFLRTVFTDIGMTK
jgi:putative tricarboxylic transport membrane protein